MYLWCRENNLIFLSNYKKKKVNIFPIMLFYDSFLTLRFHVMIWCLKTVTNFAITYGWIKLRIRIFLYYMCFFAAICHLELKYFCCLTEICLKLLVSFSISIFVRFEFSELCYYLHGCWCLVCPTSIRNSIVTNITSFLKISFQQWIPRQWNLITCFYKTNYYWIQENSNVSLKTQQ